MLRPIEARCNKIRLQITGACRKVFPPTICKGIALCRTRATYPVLVDFLAPGQTQRIALQIEVLIIGRNPRVADQHAAPRWSGNPCRKDECDRRYSDRVLCPISRSAKPLSERHRTRAANRSFVCPPQAAVSCNQRGHNPDDCDPSGSLYGLSRNDCGSGPSDLVQSFWAQSSDDCDPNRR